MSETIEHRDMQDFQEHMPMNQRPGDLDVVIPIATAHYGCVAQLDKDNLNAIYTSNSLLMCDKLPPCFVPFA